MTPTKLQIRRRRTVINRYLKREAKDGAWQRLKIDIRNLDAGMAIPKFERRKAADIADIYQDIIMRLKRGDHMNAPMLSEDYDVCPKTVRRWLRILKTHYKIDIVYIYRLRTFALRENVKRGFAYADRLEMGKQAAPDIAIRAAFRATGTIAGIARTLSIAYATAARHAKRLGLKSEYKKS